jgi:hypothetical protein
MEQNTEYLEQQKQLEQIIDNFIINCGNDEQIIIDEFKIIYRDDSIDNYFYIYRLNFLQKLIKKLIEKDLFDIFKIIYKSMVLFDENKSSIIESGKMNFIQHLFTDNGYIYGPANLLPALRSGNLEIVKFIVKYAMFGAITVYGVMCNLNYSQLKNVKKELINELINEYGRGDYKLIFRYVCGAIEENDLEFLNYFIKDIHDDDDEIEKLLHESIIYGNIPMVIAINNKIKRQVSQKIIAQCIKYNRPEILEILTKPVKSAHLWC